MPRPQSARTKHTLATPKPSGTLKLQFDSHDLLAHVEDPLRQDVSAIAVVGRTLFAACDETATVERLVRAADGNYHQQDNIALGEYFELPEGPTGEMDIEGLAIDGDFLWITGSHSLKRDKPKPEPDHAEALDELADIDRDANRYFLGRLPLVLDDGGVHRIAMPERLEDACDGPACLKMKSKGRNRLSKLLEDDRHLAASVAMPCKENGFDIEGLAVKGDRLFLGLRGPVLSGWAVAIELRVKAKKPGRLKLRKCGPDGRRYLKHVLPLHGLGIRDLRFDGDDLLVLAGPTMSHDGIGALYRWRTPLGAADDRVHAGGDVERIMELPYAHGRDQAEGIAFVPHGDELHLLVVYDSPADERLADDGMGLVADLFDIGG